MEPIGAYEAKTHLPKLLDRVAAGETFLITKYGLPIAVLQPPAHQRKSNAGEVITELRKFRQKNRLLGLSLRGMIEAGRR